MTQTFEFGLDTFLPVTVDESGQSIGGDQAIRNAVEEAVLAEAVGVDSFNIGEHYRTEFMDSAASVVLAAIASRTETCLADRLIRAAHSAHRPSLRRTRHRIQEATPRPSRVR